MIVDTMSIKDIGREFRDELQYVAKRASYWREEFSSLIKHTRKFPIEKFHYYDTPKGRNHFIIYFFASKRSEWKCPKVAVKMWWESSYGLSMAELWHYEDSSGIVAIYTTHCLSRFRERFLDGEQIATKELLESLLLATSGHMEFVTITKEICPKEDEEQWDDLTLKKALVTKAGVFFGECYLDGQEVLVKTFVTHDMLFPNQYDALAEFLEKCNSISLSDSTKSYVDFDTSVGICGGINECNREKLKE